jgi:hypothetical protein
VRAAPAEAIALQGCVLTPTGPVEDGYLVVGVGGRLKPSRPSSPKACEFMRLTG